MGLEMTAAFTRIYEHDHWGGGSGTGSRPENNIEYTAFLANFLRSNKIASVVDFGCGDWRFSRFIDWSNISYLGMDIVRSVVDRNNAKFGAENISFRMAESLFDLPPADLLICKDVLQHLPNQHITEFLKHAKNSYKWLLITNDDYPSNGLNSDILPGQWRAINLTSPPFEEKAATVLSWVVISETPTVRKRTCLLAGTDNCVGIPADFLDKRERPNQEPQEIPARIFQTWKVKDTLPDNFAIWSKTFREMNPAFIYDLWEDADNRRFIEDKFPWFLPIYDRYPAEIYRADAVRYFYLYEFGGIYADMDTECLRPLDGLRCLGDDIVLGRMGPDIDFPHSLPNAIMASRPRQEFWLLVMALLEEPARIRSAPEYATGPALLKNAVDLYASGGKSSVFSRILQQSKKLNDDQLPQIGNSKIVILKPRDFYAIDWSDPIHQRLRKQVLDGRLLDQNEKKELFDKSWLVTYWSHAW